MKYVKRPPGTSAAAIDQVERKFRVALPPDLLQFYRESEGPILYFGFKELQFFPMSDVLADIYSLEQYMPGALPLCMDGCGNICVGRARDGAIAGYFVVSAGNLAWDSAAEIAKDFFQFLRDPESPEARLKESGIGA